MTAPAAPFTVGVEEEYQLVDVETGALRSRASAVREMDWTGDIIGEAHETQIEIGTPVCTSAEQALHELARLRLQAGTAAASRDLRIVAAGAHPFSRWEGQRGTPGERYERIKKRFGRIARDEHIFGMHIHVAVPGARARIRTMNALRHFLPHVLALAASSPIFEGEDTGYSSFRTILWRRWPMSGVPPRFRSLGEYRRYVELQLLTGTILDEGNIYWSVRPHSKFPTLEIRVGDVCPRLEDVGAIVAFVRAIVAAIVKGELDEPRVPGLSRAVERDIIAVNEWRAAQRGLDARVIDSAVGEAVPLRTSIRKLADRLAPVAEELDDGEALRGIDGILERGNGATRIRHAWQEEESLPALVAWLADETIAGAESLAREP
ncbi:MAG: carboxylate-amine ligase [Longimicrobiales bacterium]